MSHDLLACHDVLHPASVEARWKSEQGLGDGAGAALDHCYNTSPHLKPGVGIQLHHSSQHTHHSILVARNLSGRLADGLARTASGQLVLQMYRLTSQPALVTAFASSITCLVCQLVPHRPFWWFADGAIHDLPLDTVLRWQDRRNLVHGAFSCIDLGLRALSSVYAQQALHAVGESLASMGWTYTDPPLLLECGGSEACLCKILWGFQRGTFVGMFPAERRLFAAMAK